MKKKAQNKPTTITDGDGPKSKEEDPQPNQHKYGVSAVSKLQWSWN